MTTKELLTTLGIYDTVPRASIDLYGFVYKQSREAKAERFDEKFTFHKCLEKSFYFSTTLHSHKNRLVHCVKTKRTQPKMASLSELLQEGKEIMKESVAPTTKTQVNC